MKPIQLLCVASLALLASVVPPATRAASPASQDRALNLADRFTVAVAHLDIERVDANAAAAAVLDFLPEPRESVAPAVDQARQAFTSWRSAFLEAGGRDVYLLVSLSDLGTQPPIAVVAPIEDRADADRIGALLKQAAPFRTMNPAVIDGCAVLAWQPTLDRLKAATDRSPRRFQAVFAAAPPGIVRAALVPYEDAARVIEELMPALPSAVGGGSSSALGQGLRWAALALAPPPDWGFEVLVQSRSATDAAALLEVIRRGLDALGKIEDVKRQLPRWADIQAALEPTVAGDTLRLRLDKNRVTELARAALIPAMIESRDKAARIALMNHLKQVGLALIMYADDHDGKLPAHLADALSLIGSARVLLLPNSPVQPPDDLARQDRAAQVAWVDQNTCMVYLRPSVPIKDIKDPARTILAHQKPETGRDSTIAVLFADGHVEILARPAFDQLLERNNPTKL